jgi:hypothetical protein
MYRDNLAAAHEHMKVQDQTIHELANELRRVKQDELIVPLVRQRTFLVCLEIFLTLAFCAGAAHIVYVASYLGAFGPHPWQPFIYNNNMTLAVFSALIAGQCGGGAWFCWEKLIEKEIEIRRRRNELSH